MTHWHDGGEESDGREDLADLIVSDAFGEEGATRGVDADGHEAQQVPEIETGKCLEDWKEVIVSVNVECSYRKVF